MSVAGLLGRGEDWSDKGRCQWEGGEKVEFHDIGIGDGKMYFLWQQNAFSTSLVTYVIHVDVM